MMPQPLFVYPITFDFVIARREKSTLFIGRESDAIVASQILNYEVLGHHTSFKIAKGF